MLWGKVKRRQSNVMGKSKVKRRQSNVMGKVKRRQSNVMGKSKERTVYYYACKHPSVFSKVFLKLLQWPLFKIHSQNSLQHLFFSYISNVDIYWKYFAYFYSVILFFYLCCQTFPISSYITDNCIIICILDNCIIIYIYY